MIHLEIRVGHPSHHVIGLRWCDLFVAEPNWPEETVIPAAALRRWLCQPGLCDMCRGRPRVMRHVVGSSVPRQSNKGRKDERSDEHLVTPPGRVFATDERARARVTGARAALARCAVKRRLDAGRHAGAPSLRTGQRSVEHSRAAHAARAGAVREQTLRGLRGQRSLRHDRREELQRPPDRSSPHAVLTPAGAKIGIDTGYSATKFA